MRSHVRVCYALGSLLVPGIAAAAVNTAPAIAKAGGGQHALAVGFDEQGQLRARVCATEPCTLEGATTLAVPEDAARAASGATLRVARLGLERRAIVVEIPLAGTSRGWAAVVTAPLTGATPLTPFAGYTGFTEGTGSEGERSGPMVLVGEEGVYVGVQREGQDLCGRPAMLAPEALDPKTLTLRSAKLQRLTQAERDAAAPVEVTAVEATPAPALLAAQWATSAAPSMPPSALTDGDPETAWAEHRGGVGRGEFAVLRAPAEVPISAFELAFPAHGAAHQATPTELFLATDSAVYRVPVPVPAPRRVRAILPAPVKTACVALVLEAASDPHKDAAVAVGEVVALPAGGGDVASLVQRLKGGGPDAEAAGAVLAASGAPAFAAVAAAFPGLDEGGRRVALDVLDAAPCEVALPAYVAARATGPEGNARHASGAFPRCPGSAAALAAALPPLPPEQRVVLAEELSSLSPETLVPAITPLLETAKQRERRVYRALLSVAAQQERARGALTAELTRAGASPRVLLELLRGLGAALPSFGDAASRAFAAVATPAASFRVRYLLLGPAAELAATDAGAQAFLRAALTTEPRAEIRAEAARVARDGQRFAAELIRGADDGRVRVREAAILSLGASRVEASAPYVARRLRADAWPLVRSAAALALADLAPTPHLDGELARAVADDDAVVVRRAAVRALGAHRAMEHRELVLDRFTNVEEDPTVRAEAALALGALCDAASVDALTASALELVDTKAKEEERAIGRNALGALGWIHPPDLERRLAPLRAPQMPGVVKRLAGAALSDRGRCGAAPGGLSKAP